MWQRTTGARKRPSFLQFDTMQLFPFQHMRQGSLRKLAIDTAGLDLNGNLEIALDRVKVRRPMIAVVHGDNDSEKATQFGHASL